MPENSKKMRFAWMTLEAQEVIELKEAMQDRDIQDTADFFWRVVLPRVREAAQRRGVSLQGVEEDHERLPG